MLQSVRGTHDLLPEAQAKHNTIIDAARMISERFGFHEMSTPIFEFSGVFKRTLGEASDIVNKEMYTFTDRGGEEITLRPEGTAPIARAFISEGLSQRTPLKVYYQGPMFRYERPQKGRQRQFHQFGIELLGAASPYADVEVLTFGHEFMRALKVDTKSTLELNSIGDEESRAKFTEALVKYLSQNSSQLSAESQKRLTINPLRILDSKDEGDRALLKNAPVISEYYNETSKSFFETVCNSLKAVGVPFTLNPFLVRGLDYYAHCVFEWRTTELGAQDAICSGGRYDGLIKQMGGPDTPAVGFGAGLERLAMLSPIEPKHTRPLSVIPVHATAEAAAFELCYRLRKAGFVCEIGFSGNLSKRMKKASSLNAWAAIVVGPDELARGEVQVKLMDSSEQKMVQLADLENSLRTFKG